ncbi:MAG: hypothetical protein AB1529_04450 [Candidatus Micrarchaeota archaeon]
MKLTPAEGNHRGQEQPNRFLKYAPILVLGAAAGLTLASGESNAEQPRRAQCSASIERGSIRSYTSTTRRARLVNTPVLESNRYLQLTLPNSYMDELATAARARPEAERPAFVTEAVQRNVELALTRMGSRRSATFDCAPLTEPPAASTPQPDAARPRITEEGQTARPDAGAPRITEEGAQPPARVEPPPSQAPDGGVQPDGGGQRRRVIQPEPAPGQKSSAQKPSTSGLVAPVPPVKRGGEGTDKKPYVIEIPVPSSGAAGTVLSSETFPYLYSSGSESVKVYIAIRFVTAAGSTKTSEKDLVRNVVPLASAYMMQKLRERGIAGSVESKSLVSSVTKIVRNARENPVIGAYVNDG